MSHQTDTDRHTDKHHSLLLDEAFSVPHQTDRQTDMYKTATAGDVCYFMGGSNEGSYTNKVYSVSLPALVSQLNSDSSAKDTQTWKELPQLPVTQAAPLSISGSLLAVGGDKEGKPVSALHLYQPDAGQWVKVGDLPSPRCHCTCVMISEKELLVAGGATRALGTQLNKVELAEISQ